MSSKYNVTNYSVDSLLGYINAGEIAIPEIQRPFVWKGVQVRDLIDSLYQGFPTGYLIIWQNPSVRLRDGSSAVGKKVLIDGQQRVTALMTSIAGQSILTDNYEERTIRIAFNPQAGEDEERFAVQTPAHVKGREWIEDISVLFTSDADPFDVCDRYIEANPDADKKKIRSSITSLTSIKSAQLGAIILDSALTIDEVTEIFVRINSKGKTLNAADFAMSKIAADEQYGGNMLRKAIDYFCHLATQPDFFHQKPFKNDTAFAGSEYIGPMTWLKDNHSEIYDPTYADMLRVSFMHIFHRGKLANLVSLLSGRDFETKTFRDEIVEDSFCRLKQGVFNFMNEYNFKQFVLAIENAGFKFKHRQHISKNNLDFAYTLFLLLKEGKEVPAEQIKSYVSRWFVLSTLTGRYTGSPESQMHRDLREIKTKGFLAFLKEVSLRFSDTYWEVELPNALDTSSTTSPCFVTYLAALVKENKPSLFRPGISIQSLFSMQGDAHHIFPRAYLQRHGINDIYLYNQVANFAYIDKPLNIAIGDRAPSQYFTQAFDQCQTGNRTLGDITDEALLRQNLADNAIPEDIVVMTADDYKDFLAKRRILMAKTIRDYYSSL